MPSTEFGALLDVVPHDSGKGWSVNVPIWTQEEGGRSHRLLHAGLLRPWHATAGALPSSPMPPFTRNHLWRKPHLGAQPWLALTTTAGSNRSIDTDVLSAGFAGLLAAGHLQR